MINMIPYKRLLILLLLINCLIGCTTSNQIISPEQTPNLDPYVLQLALRAYQQAACRHQIKRPYLTIVDFTKPSNQKRLWVLDMATHQRLFYTYVAHGINSGRCYARYFSNQVNSLESSLGVIVTGKAYYGSNGYSLRLHGLEKGFNDHLFHRFIVVHGAQYVSAQYAKAHGQLGHTWGCFAIPEAMVKPIIDTIQGGSLLFAYYPDPKWLHHSTYLNSHPSDDCAPDKTAVH